MIFPVIDIKLNQFGLRKCPTPHPSRETTDRQTDRETYQSILILANDFHRFPHKTAEKTSWHGHYVTVTLCIYKS